MNQAHFILSYRAQAIESGFDLLHADPFPTPHEGFFSIPDGIPDEWLSDYALDWIAREFPSEPREVRLAIVRAQSTP